MKLRITWLATLSILTMLLSACGAPELKLSRPPYTYNTTINVVTPPITNINPVTSFAYGNSLYDQMVYQTLVALDPSGHPEPSLAKSWSRSRDATVWHITLNPYAKWWSGRPVTAQDVAWTLQFYRNPASGYPRYRELADVARIKVLSPIQLEIFLTHPDPDFVVDRLSPRGSLWILPSFLLDHLPMSRVRVSDYLNRLRDVVGSGPFRPFKATPGSMAWVAYPHYFLGAPRTKYLRWTWPDLGAAKPTSPNILWSRHPLSLSRLHYRDVAGASNREWVLVVHPHATLSSKQLRDILTVATNRRNLPGIPAYSGVWSDALSAIPPRPTQTLKQIAARAGYHHTAHGWVNSHHTFLTLILREPRSADGRNIARRLHGEWQHAGIHVLMVPPSYHGTTDLSIASILASPLAEPLPANALPLIWSRRYWYASRRIVDWSPNVWQPFYTVQHWRVLSKT